MPIMNKWGRVAHNRDIREILGLSQTAHLPTEGGYYTHYQGWTLWINPLYPLAPGKLHTSKPHRIMAKCPDCDTVVSAGRTGQHKCPAQRMVRKKVQNAAPGVTVHKMR